jgi:hypothetical protein
VFACRANNSHLSLVILSKIVCKVNHHTHFSTSLANVKIAKKFPLLASPSAGVTISTYAVRQKDGTMTEKEQATSPALDADRQGKAKQYARIGRWLFVLSLVISALYAALWLALGVSTAVKGRLLAATHNPWLLVAGYGLVFGLVYTLLTLPLSYYSGFVLPHRYGQSTQTFGGWVGDLMKGLLVGGLLGGLVLEGVYWLLRAVQDLWWLWAGLGYLLFAVVLSNLFPVLIAPLFNKFVPLEDEDLTARLTALAARADARVQGVFRFDMSRRTKSANAGLMGIGNTRRIGSALRCNRPSRSAGCTSQTWDCFGA